MMVTYNITVPEHLAQATAQEIADRTGKRLYTRNEEAEPGHITIMSATIYCPGYPEPGPAYYWSSDIQRFLYIGQHRDPDEEDDLYESS